MVEKKEKIRFGVIGAGKIGTYHVRTLAKMPQVELVGVCDINSMRAQILAWKYNCVSYSNYEDLIPQVDAVIVAVPTDLHCIVGISAMNKGVHCLIEKPLASSNNQARQLLEVSRQKDVLLQVGHVERFNPAVIETFKYVKKPRYIVIQRLGPYDTRAASIGVVLDLMIHDIDLLSTMIDSPITSFEAVGVSVLSQHEDIANVRFRFKNGCMADVTASRVSLEKARYMRIYQESAYISVDFMNARIKVYRKKTPVLKSINDIKVEYPKFEKQQPILAEINHFIDCIHHMKDPWPSGERGSQALNLALKITDELKRYNISSAQNPEPPKPIQVVSDIGKATKVIINETIHNIGINKS